MLISGALCFVINTLMMLVPLQTSSEASYMNLNPFILFVYVCIIAPLLEELICRFCLYKLIKRILSKIGPCFIKLAIILAAVISSFVFAMLHGSSAQIIYAFIFGLLFCAAYEKESSIIVPIMMHFTANFLSFILTNIVTEFNLAFIIIDIILIACIIVIAIQIKLEHLTKRVPVVAGSSPEMRSSCHNGF